MNNRNEVIYKEENKMTKTKKTTIEIDMRDVIESSRKMRQWLENEDVSLDDKKDQLKIINTKLKLNNNIVSASIVTVQIEKLGAE